MKCAGHKLVVEFNALKEKLMKEKITLRAASGDAVLFLIFQARVLGEIDYTLFIFLCRLQSFFYYDEWGMKKPVLITKIQKTIFVYFQMVCLIPDVLIYD